MDNDSAHHANIALHMYLNRDYVNLIDAGKDYLDKPHLHFWLCVFSYKIFGVTTFAYKFPSFLFTILGTYSIFRLGTTLYGKEAGKLSALIAASAIAYILSNNDVRMDAILTACIAFATWQGVEFIQRKEIMNALGFAVGLALGFNTKGHIAVFTPAIGLFFYILYLKNWKIFWNWKWLVVLICFAACIFPVVYCFYLQYNLHPEKIVRGKDHINGVKFILLGQSIERFQGDSFGSSAKNDYFFFFHAFLWAFAPWSILAYVAFINHLKYFFLKKYEWLTSVTFIAIGLLLTFSGFKLPHYVNIIFPTTSIMTATLVLKNPFRPKNIFMVQLCICALLFILVAYINVWAFPVKSPFIIAIVIFLLAVFFYFLKSKLTLLQKSIGISVVAVVVTFFLLNANFYPQLLKYQGGNELAKKIRGNVDPANIYFWKNNYSSSFNFYTATERYQFEDTIFNNGKRPIWLLFDKHSLKEIQQSGYKIGLMYSAPDFEITRLTIKFILPDRRKNELTEMIIGEIINKK